MNYISVITDNNYAPHTGALIYSIVKTNNRDLDYKFFVLGYQLTRDTTDKFSTLSQIINREIVVIPIDEKTIPELPVYRRYSFLIYVKLYLAKILPITVNWVLNLDVDTIVNGSLEPIFNYEGKEQYSLLVVEDYEGCDKYKVMSNIENSDNYFNAGVCYFNLKYWREEHLMGKCETFILNNSHINEILEQGTLSNVCRTTAKVLPIKYNVLAGYFFEIPLIQRKYEIELYEALHNPVIIHYAEPVKPWHKNCFHPLTYLYRDALEQTPWRGIKFEIKANKKCLHIINMKFQYLLHNMGLKKQQRFYKKL